MVNVSSEKIKELRIKTGAGIMDCKKALAENNLDIEKSIDWLRKKGAARASKKAGREAAEGLIAISLDGNNKAAIVEVNSETDFVAKNDDFKNFVCAVANVALKSNGKLEDLLKSPFEIKEKVKVKDKLNDIISKIGENIIIRRVSLLDSINVMNEGYVSIGSYVHNKVQTNIGKIGVLVIVTRRIEKESEELKLFLRNLSMHIAAAKPEVISIEDLDDEKVKKERDILFEQVKETGKPIDVIEKIVDGKMRKYYTEVALLEQNWIMEPEKKVIQIIKEFNHKNKELTVIKDFSLYVLGDGIDKEKESFADEVKAQVVNKAD